MLAGTDLAIGPVVDAKMQHGGLGGFDVGFVGRTLVFGKDAQQGLLSFCLQILLFLGLDGDTYVDLLSEASLASMRSISASTICRARLQVE